MLYPAMPVGSLKFTMYIFRLNYAFNYALYPPMMTLFMGLIESTLLLCGFLHIADFKARVGC